MNKRYIISELLSKNKIDTDELTFFVLNNNIEYSQNSNGIFVNLSLINDELINILYDKIVILTMNNTSDIIINKEVNKEVNTKIKGIDKNEFNIEKKTDNIHMTSSEKKLIELSKQ